MAEINVPIPTKATNDAPVTYIAVVRPVTTYTGEGGTLYYVGSVEKTADADPPIPTGLVLSSPLAIGPGAVVTVQSVPGQPVPVIVTGSLTAFDTYGPSAVVGPSTTQIIVRTSASTQATTSKTGTSTGKPRITDNTGTGTVDPKPTESGDPNAIQDWVTQSNNGPVIGAAIGCLVAGLLVGFLIAFFIYRKRSQRQAQYTPSPTVVESKAFDAPPPLPVVDDKISRFLLDVSPDKEITGELRSLGTLIQQHVENNYHLNPVQTDPRSLTALLTQLGVTSNGNGLSPDVVPNLALDPRTRQVALQHVISQVLFTSIDVSSRSRLSMLPAPIAAFLQSIPPRETGERNNEVLSTALNQWRALSAFILHPSRSQRTPLPVFAAAVSPQASGLADALDTFLHYFVDDNLRFQQTSHLQAVITECTKFGYVLLSQPHEWRLVNEPGPGHHSGPHGYNAVVCAGLVKVTLKDGIPTSSPQQVVPPMTVTV